MSERVYIYIHIMQNVKIKLLQYMFCHTILFLKLNEMWTFKWL